MTFINKIVLVIMFLLSPILVPWYIWDVKRNDWDDGRSFWFLTKEFYSYIWKDFTSSNL